MNIELG